MKLMACYLNLLMATPKQVIFFSCKIFRLSPYILCIFVAAFFSLRAHSMEKSVFDNSHDFIKMLRGK